MGFDLGFCLVFLPLMIFMFPVERWWGTYPVFFSLFVAWLYALEAMVFSLGITLLFPLTRLPRPSTISDSTRKWSWPSTVGACG